MGAVESTVLTVEQLAQYEKSTFFTRREVTSLYARFESMGGSTEVPVSATAVIQMPELRVNPFRKRIAHVYGSFDKRSGKLHLSFHQFLNLMNTFSSRTSIEVKAFWAFKIYDFNQDNFIDLSDVVKLLDVTAGESNLTRQQKLKIAHRVMDEADLDGNNKLSRTEFMRLLFRVPDFASKFNFNIQFNHRNSAADNEATTTATAAEQAESEDVVTII